MGRSAPPLSLSAVLSIHYSNTLLRYYTLQSHSPCYPTYLYR